jgi:2'-5' RNA ligase
MTMRMFLGTTIPMDQAKELRMGIPHGAFIGEPRRVPLEQWHVTALFIGERPAASLPIIRAAALELARITPPITLCNGRPVTMPKDEPSMVWIRFRPEPRLTALHLALAERTGTAPSIHRPYWPHITLARARSKRLTPFDGDVLIERLVLKELTLFRSTPGPDGSTHEPLESWPFNGTDPTGHAVVD